MSALSRAQTRLEQALARLEKSLEIRAGDGQVNAALDEEVTSLRNECRDLRGKLEATSKRHARMQSMVSDVATRLDGAIGELDQLLER